jgi:hypothetical protein
MNVINSKRYEENIVTNPLLNGLVQYNPMITNSVATIGVDGADTGVVYGDYGDFQNMADFPNNTSVVNLGDSDNFTFGNGLVNGEFTFSTRAKFDSLGSMVLFGKLNGTDKEYRFRLVTGNITMRFETWDNSTGDEWVVDYAQSPVIDTVYWYLIRLKAGVLSMFIDGVNVSNSPVSNAQENYTAMENTTAELLLGKHFNTGANYNGKLRDFAVWNRGLPDNEIDIIDTRYTNNTPILSI